MSASVILHKGREKSLLRRHPWIFASAIKDRKGKLHPGDTVEVLSSKGDWLGRGAWSPVSQIRVRIWTFDKDEVVDNAFFLRRIEQALATRQHLSGDGLNAWRLVAAESDGLPGVTIDRYANVLVCQFLSAGAEKQRDKIVWALNSLLPESSVYERSDAAVRDKEGLEGRSGVLSGEPSAEVEVLENGLHFLVDIKQGHKTGFYLDQKVNRQRIAHYASGRRVLNCFSYTGAVGVYCQSQGASETINVDTAADALSLAKRNYSLNQLAVDDSHFVQDDVFKALRAYRQAGERFDMVVLDPPKFVENKQHLQHACRGYKDINLLALQLLNPGGILCTFSCSGLMPEDLFRKVVADAALDAGRELRYLEFLTQSWDHPVSSNYPEGLYLKGLIGRVD